MSKIEKISSRELAKRLNVSEGAVRKAIARGDLGKAYIESEKKINYQAAIKTVWAQQQEVIKPKPGVSRSKAINKLEAKEKPSPRDLMKEFDNNDRDDSKFKDEEDEWLNDEENRTGSLLENIKITSNLKHSEAMRRREIIALALDKKKLEEAEGILVRRDRVEKALFTVGSELKKALFTMPQRIIRDIMAAPNEVEAINIMNDELTHILSNYGNLKSNTFS